MTHSPSKGLKKSQKPVGTSENPGRVFIILALDMTWRLALAVLIPILAGVYLDKLMKSSAFLFVGLAIALIGVTLVLWRSMKVANSLPVPKLTDAERRAIKKQYEEEDDD